MPIKPYGRPSGWYHLRGAHFGIRVDRSAGTRSFEQARLLAAKLEAEIFERHVKGDKAVATFAEAAAGYLRGGGDGTHMSALIHAFGARRLRDISQADLDRFAHTRLPQAQDATRLRKIYTPFIATWNWAVRDNLAEPRRWQKPQPGQKRVDWRTPEEIETLLGAIPNAAARGLIAFYVGAGARATEALDLEWRDVSPAAERVTLWETKGGYARHVDLPARVRAALPARRADGAVFLNSRGQPWHAYDAVNLVLKRACRKAGLPRLSCHVLRHTWASWAYATTRDLDFVMKQGGWRSPELAMRYVHAGTDDLAEAVRVHNWEIGGSACGARRVFLKEAK